MRKAIYSSIQDTNIVGRVTGYSHILALRLLSYPSPQSKALSDKSLYSQYLQQIVESDGYPIAIRTTPLHLIDLAFSSIR